MIAIAAELNKLELILAVQFGFPGFSRISCKIRVDCVVVVSLKDYTS